jgi:hypothetical protein
MQPTETTGDEVTTLEHDQAGELVGDQPEAVDVAQGLAAGELDQTASQPATIAPRATRRRHKARNQGGRPSKLTAAVAIELGLAVGRGQRLAAAAQSAGVGISTAYRWLAAGRAGDPRFAAIVALRRKPPKTHWHDWLGKSLGKGLF